VRPPAPPGPRNGTAACGTVGARFAACPRAAGAGTPAAGDIAGIGRGGIAELGGTVSLGAARETMVASPSSSSS
jgi:hypothetical protein